VVTQRLEFESLPHTESHFESTLGTFHRLQNEVESFREEMARRKVERKERKKEERRERKGGRTTKEKAKFLFFLG